MQPFDLCSDSTASLPLVSSILFWSPAERYASSGFVLYDPSNALMETLGKREITSVLIGDCYTIKCFEPFNVKKAFNDSDEEETEANIA